MSFGAKCIIMEKNSAVWHSWMGVIIIKSEKYGFLDLAEEVLSSSSIPLSVNEMWARATATGLDVRLNSSGKTPWATLAAQLYLDIRDNVNSLFVQESKRPALFKLKDVPVPIHDATTRKPSSIYLDTGSQRATDLKPCKSTKSSPEGNKTEYDERDLHVLLSTFVRANPHFRCYVKTIYHESSLRRDKGVNEWLHPDLVGVYFPFEEYRPSTLRLLETLKKNPYKLFSFEMKKEITFSTLRKYYFQAVSNSSWANEGYLVALKIDNDQTLLDEIRRLNNAFGIGVIRLDPSNIDQSEIIFGSRENEILDWDTVDRLADENPDFALFLDSLMEDAKVGKVKSKYDKVLQPEDMKHYLEEKSIS